LAGTGTAAASPTGMPKSDVSGIAPMVSGACTSSPRAEPIAGVARTRSTVDPTRTAVTTARKVCDRPASRLSNAVAVLLTP